jgi:hypothetical protein
VDFHCDYHYKRKSFIVLTPGFTFTTLHQTTRPVPTTQKQIFRFLNKSIQIFISNFVTKITFVQFLKLILAILFKMFNNKKIIPRETGTAK